jgi:hypothetical protein
MKFTLEPATDSTHKWVGVFTDETTKDERRIPFGAKGMSDYTLNKNPLRRQSYLSRHRSREDWTNPMTAGALSRWILWESTSIQEAVRKFRRRFSLS